MLRLFGGVAAVVLAFAVTMPAGATPAQASRTLAQNSGEREAGQQTSPVTLVNLARQGYLRNQGIPTHLTLAQDIASGRITPEVLVQAGIENHLISSETLNNPGYLNIVEVELRSVVQDFAASSSDN